ncbi:MAG: heme biosynthesis HemY N-terminal domain-containing protein [Methylocella sp.]
MIRVLLFFAILIALAFAETWLVDRPGELVLDWNGYHIETSVLVAIGAVIVAAAALLAVWSLIRFVFKIPSLMAVATRGQRHEKGYAALSRGMIAVGAGDAQLARKSAVEAHRLLRNEPLALLLKAQAAQLSGETGQAEAAFQEMTKRNDTRLLGLRGLHVEAQRQGDVEKAQQYAETAREIAPLPWAAKADFEHKVAAGDWKGALALLDSPAGAKFLDKTLRERHRAVLETALALDNAETDPAGALALARAALKRAPAFTPAAALAARLVASAGDARKAAKLIESAWAEAPHPDLAKIYLGLYPGESSAARLGRALALARLAPREAESKIAVAQAAIAAGDFNAAREAVQPLIDGPERPTARICRLMAELEEKQHGAGGYIREWLTRASHAPRDPTWVADGVVSDRWRPISPVTGRLDAFVWQKPIERLSSGDEAEDAVFAQVLPPAPRLLIEEAQTASASPAPGSPPAAEVSVAEAPSASDADSNPAPAPFQPQASAAVAADDEATPAAQQDEAPTRPKPWGIEHILGRTRA